jgi:DNA (cytosine-5)-methyltransferase 1
MGSRRTLLAGSLSNLIDQAPTLAAENMARIEDLFRQNLYDLRDAERPECHSNGTSYRAV